MAKKKEEIKQMIPSLNSDSEDWMVFYNYVKKYCGKRKAREWFERYWADRGSSSANTLMLRQFLEKEGIEVETGFLDTLIDAGSAVGDYVSNTYTTLTYMLYGVAGLAIIGTGIMIYAIVKNPKETAQLGTAIATRGVVK